MFGRSPRAWLAALAGTALLLMVGCLGADSPTAPAVPTEVGVSSGTIVAGETVDSGSTDAVLSEQNGEPGDPDIPENGDPDIPENGDPGGGD